MRWLIFSALLALVALAALNWRAQLQTQQKLDALSATLVERPAPPVPANVAQTPPPALAPAQAQNAAPREISHVALPPYVIEPPDQLTIEVVVKDPKTGTTDRLPGQAISGSFQVRPDGTVGLGLWGSVVVTGLTLEQASNAVSKQIAKTLPKGVDPDHLKVIVDVIAYNSKRYYVIFDQGGYGEQVFPFPITGSETVLDALSNIYGLPDVASKRNIWVSRPSLQPGQARQTHTVDWKAITQLGDTKTNYRLQPGDRLYVKTAK